MSASARKIFFLFIFVTHSLFGNSNWSKKWDPPPILGKTSFSEVISQMGNPGGFTNTFFTNGAQINQISYAWAVVFTGGGKYPNVMPARALDFYFFDNRLVGYRHYSSFKEDCTEFDTNQIQFISNNSSKRVQVRERFGEPSGIFIYPMVSSSNETGESYVYSEARFGFMKHHYFERYWFLTYSTNDVVLRTDLKLVEF